ncbi:MAG: hypothetical protein NC311_13760 [Muribaculaceae bacterium]|nr:hypothetical protein [Muribaculaceae bacterium]
MNYGQNAMTEIFGEVTVLGQPMIFTNLWIDPSTVPKGLYVYEVQHDSDGRGIPVQIAEHILVNHWGTLLTNRPIRLDTHPVSGKKYRLIDPEEDWNYEGYPVTVLEYLDKHPPLKAKSRGGER